MEETILKLSSANRKEEYNNKLFKRVTLQVSDSFGNPVKLQRFVSIDVYGTFMDMYKQAKLLNLEILTKLEKGLLNYEDVYATINERRRLVYSMSINIGTVKFPGLYVEKGYLYPLIRTQYVNNYNDN